MRLYNINELNSIITTQKLLYCSNDLNYGIHLEHNKKALQKAYIQANNDKVIKFLVIDLDHNNPLIFEDVGLPAPNFIVMDREKNTSHLIYVLENFITKDYERFSKNLSYFAKIQQAYNQALKGDTSYIGLIMKNPNNKRWLVANYNYFYWYSLDELADYVELPKKLVKKQVIGEGRNCYLFETVRKIAYKEVLFYKNNEAQYTDFYNFILHKLEKLNIFQNAPALEFNELKNIAKSISKWTWNNFTAAKFSSIQTTRSHTRKKVKNLNMIKERFVNELTTK